YLYHSNRDRDYNHDHNYNRESPEQQYLSPEQQHLSPEQQYLSPEDAPIDAPGVHYEPIPGLIPIVIDPGG
ncbi:hypothetical protein PENVUL_c230G03940, partial [Penicillium vulpinum]